MTKPKRETSSSDDATNSLAEEVIDEIERDARGVEEVEGTDPDEEDEPDEEEEPDEEDEGEVEQDEQNEQGVLVPMSEDELRAAGVDLATRVRQLRDMKTRHAGKRAEMKKERDALQKDIDRIAGTIKEQGR
jgi:hypothetical protein